MNIDPEALDEEPVTLTRHSIYEETDTAVYEEVSQWDAVVDAWARSR